jgi:hypothetical protein
MSQQDLLLSPLPTDVCSVGSAGRLQARHPELQVVPHCRRRTAREPACETGITRFESSPLVSATEIHRGVNVRQ